MSLHIIKCKTILKINEIETINLTQYLNFHRHAEPGGGSLWGGTPEELCFCGEFQVAAWRGDLVRPRGGKEVLSMCKLGIGHIWIFVCLLAKIP